MCLPHYTGSCGMARTVSSLLLSVPLAPGTVPAYCRYSTKMCYRKEGGREQGRRKGIQERERQ